MPSLQSVVVIPARLTSSRLPRKVLADIAGKPMLWHVYHQCLQARTVDAVHIATDAEEVAAIARSWGARVWMTDENCISGTERIVAIADRLEADYIINVQGDQPLIDPAVLDQMVAVFAQLESKPDAITPVYRLDPDQIFDPNVVKVLLRHDGDALYFSRSAVPYVRDVPPEQWHEVAPFWGHVGIYGYRRDVLLAYHDLPHSPLEAAEKLEQLRFLETGKRIFTFPCDCPHISVDTVEDLVKVRAMFARLKRPL